MGLTARASAIVVATPEEILELVLDMDRYRLADHKIRRVTPVTGTYQNGAGSVEIWSRFSVHGFRRK
ncbi:MAG: hypothetical protein ACI8TX_003577 [Hyphomicrobiaceae bacterium]|jgi:hypothetical protein